MRILVQPFSEKSMGEFLIESLSGAHGDFDSFQAAVAFAKRSGVQHIEHKLKEFVENGKSARIVVGIDLGGTTSEGLEALLDALGDTGELLLNHDENMFVTFHPKIYFFESAKKAILIIGSGNLTAGGLYSNDEGFAIMELDPSDVEDQAVIEQYKDNFQKWCDEDSELVRRVRDKDDIQALVNAGYVPSEAIVSLEADEAADGEIAPDADSDAEDVHGEGDEGEEPEPEAKEKFFGRMKGRKRPPPKKVIPKIKPKKQPQPQSLQQDEPQVGQQQEYLQPDEAPEANIGFVMTLQKTDVGTGQTTPGKARRSPEIFIPLVARDAEPDFWGWDNLFVDDPNKAGKKDRNDVKMRLGGDVINVNMFYNDVKKDLRLRSEALRSAGDVDDIIRIEKTDGSETFDYCVQIIPQGTGDYVHYRAACSNKVKGISKKYWGYYTTE